MALPNVGSYGYTPPGGDFAETEYGANTVNIDALNAQLGGQQRQTLNDVYGLRNTATGAGYYGQMDQAQALAAMGQQPAGPSVAELAMQAQSANAMRQNLALAASGSGPSGASAALNAQNQNAMMQGQLTQQLGVQRAQEAMANRQFQMQAAQAAGGMYGQAQAGQQAAYGGAGQLNTGLGGQTAQMAGLYGNIAQGDQQTALGYNKLAEDRRQFNQNQMMKYIAGGTAAAGSMMAMSDIRAKTDIAPAGQQIADTFRQASPSSYGYLDPSMGIGTHYGPMAQELERTPAGASVVVPQQNGMKAIDTGRLALLNASETGQQRRELDALKSVIAQQQPVAVASGVAAPQAIVPVTTATVASKQPLITAADIRAQREAAAEERKKKMGEVGKGLANAASILGAETPHYQPY